MSESLILLTKKEEMSENEQFANFSIIFFKLYTKHTKNKILDFLSQIFLSKLLIRSFPLSDLSDSLTVAHLS